MVEATITGKKTCVESAPRQKQNSSFIPKFVQLVHARRVKLVPLVEGQPLVDSIAVLIFVDVLVELTNTVFVNSTLKFKFTIVHVFFEVNNTDMVKVSIAN